MKLLFSQVKPLVARVLGFCETDPRVAQYTNEAARRLLRKGLWAGCYGRFTIKTCDGCITWPRMIETIESVASCSGVGSVRNQWFEFLEGGYGTQGAFGSIITPWGSSFGGSNLLDKGTVCSYRQLSGGLNSVIRTYPSHVSDVGKTIIYQGYDENGTWIRTLNSGVWIDGEQVALALPFTNTTKRFTYMSGVIKAKTNLLIRVYEYDAVTLGEKDIAVYEPDETVPHYRRSQIPVNCVQANAGCVDIPVNVMAKLRHIPVLYDNDYVIPPCEDAIKLMVQGIRKEENDLLQEAVAYETMAVSALQDQTLSYLGDAVAPMRMVGADSWGGGIRQAY